MLREEEGRLFPRWLVVPIVLLGAAISSAFAPADAEEPDGPRSAAPIPSSPVILSPAEPTATPSDPVPTEEPEPTASAHPGSSRGDTTSPEARARANQPREAVAAVDDAFRPMELTVTVGTEIVWTNQGNNPHTVTADDRAFDSGTLESGQSFSVAFDRIGRVPYYCQIHGEPGSGMFGVLIVRAAPAEQEERADEVTPTAGPDELARTGIGTMELGLTALGLAVGGLVVLRMGRRAMRERG